MNFLHRIFLAITMIASASLAANELKDSTSMTLNLSNQQLSNVPEDILFHSNLTELWLDDNQIRELPDAIAQLATLKRLSIYKNQLVVFPKMLLQMANLERINASQNSLNSIPVETSRIIALMPFRNGLAAGTIFLNYACKITMFPPYPIQSPALSS